MRTALVVIAIVLSACGSYQSLEDCERAFDDYVLDFEPDVEQPSILKEDWCFEHLTGQGN